VLQNLPNKTDITAWQFISHDVEMQEVRGRIAMLFLIPVYEGHDDVDTKIVGAQWEQLLTDTEITATQVNKSEA